MKRTLLSIAVLVMAMGAIFGSSLPAHAVDASGIHTEMKFVEYGGTQILECGGTYEIDSWIAAQIKAKADTPGPNAGWQVEVHYGEVGDPVDEDGLYKKFDRMQWEKQTLSSQFVRYGRADWFNQEHNEAYVWQFQVWAEGHYLQDAFPTGELCEITVTRVE